MARLSLLTNDHSPDSSALILRIPPATLYSLQSYTPQSVQSSHHNYIPTCTCVSVRHDTPTFSLAYSAYQITLHACAFFPRISRDCRRPGYPNFLFQVTGTEKESWSNTIDKQEVLDGMDNMPGMEKIKWAPIFKQLVEVTPPNTIVNFELLWRNPQPSWCSPGARVIQIGDSAHSYLPASGNGATQAIEDAISIASCLQIGGKENIPQSVRVHIRFR